MSKLHKKQKLAKKKRKKKKQQKLTPRQIKHYRRIREHRKERQKILHKKIKEKRRLRHKKLGTGPYNASIIDYYGVYFDPPSTQLNDSLYDSIYDSSALDSDKIYDEQMKNYPDSGVEGEEYEEEEEDYTESEEESESGNGEGSSGNSQGDDGKGKSVETVKTESGEGQKQKPKANNKLCNVGVKTTNINKVGGQTINKEMKTRQQITNIKRAKLNEKHTQAKPQRVNNLKTNIGVNIKTNQKYFHTNTKHNVPNNKIIVKGLQDCDSEADLIDAIFDNEPVYNRVYETQNELNAMLAQNNIRYKNMHHKESPYENIIPMMIKPRQIGIIPFH